MLTRRTHLPALLVAVCAAASVCRAGDSVPSLSGHFVPSPRSPWCEGSRRGPASPLSLSGVDAAELAKRWRTSVDEGGQVTTLDPATGLAVVQRRRWLPEAHALLIDTTVANRGQQTVRLGGRGRGRLDLPAARRPGRGLPQAGLPQRRVVRLDLLDRPGLDPRGQDWHHPGREHALRAPLHLPARRPRDDHRAGLQARHQAQRRRAAWPSATATRPCGRPRSTVPTPRASSRSWSWTSAPATPSASSSTSAGRSTATRPTGTP